MGPVPSPVALIRILYSFCSFFKGRSTILNLKPWMGPLKQNGMYPYLKIIHQLISKMLPRPFKNNDHLLSISLPISTYSISDAIVLITKSPKLSKIIFTE